MDIKKIKHDEIQEIKEFLEGLEDYGHIFHYSQVQKLDESFKKILEGIEEVRNLMKDSWSM